MVEVIYQAQWTKWWTVQPEMQYIRPGGGVPRWAHTRLPRAPNGLSTVLHLLTKRL